MHTDVTPARPRRRGRPRVEALVLALAATVPLAGVAGCGDGGDRASSTTSSPAERSSSTTEPRSSSTLPSGTDNSGGDCPASDAVAEVVGGAVDRGSTSGTSFSSGSDGKAVSYSYAGCDYEVTEGPDGEVTIARITGSEIDGQPGPTGSELFDALAAAAESEAVDDGFVTIDGIGDEAYRDGDRIAARNDAGVLVVSVEDADGEPDLEATEELATAMARRSPGLTVDGFSKATGCTELDDPVVQATGSDVTDHGASGGASGIGDAKLEWTGCNFTLADGGRARVAMGSADGWDAWVAAKRDSPLSTSYEELTVGEFTAFDDGERIVVDTGAAPLMIETNGDDLVPDQATLRVDLAELALGG